MATSFNVTYDGYTSTATTVTLKFTPSDGYTSPNTSLGSVYVYWNDASGVNHTIYTLPALSGTAPKSNTPGQQTYTITGLSPSTTYSNNDLRMVGVSSGSIVFGPTALFSFTTQAPPQYTVSYNSQGGSNTPTSQTVTAGSSVTLGSPGTKTGYSFSGWYDGPNALNYNYIGTSGSNYTPTASITLYAVWAALPSYTITWDTTNGGSVSPTSSSGPTGTTGTVPTPSYTGYNFNGWYTALSGGSLAYNAGGTYTIGSSNVTYYAQWTAKPVPAVSAYASISGTGLVGTSLTATGGTYTNTSSVVTKIAYQTNTSFSGNTGNVQNSPYTVTSIDATSPAYYFAAYDVVTGTNGLTYYFYSQSYISAKYQVTFAANGGSSTPANIIYRAGDSITLPAAISRTGYTFAGWNDGTNTYSANASYTPPSSGSFATTKTFTAQWTGNPASVISYPTISGTGRTTETITGTAGTYSNYTSIETRLIYKTGTSFSYTDNYRTTNPYTVQDIDPQGVPYNYIVLDIVTGNDGVAKYFWSGGYSGSSISATTGYITTSYKVIYSGNGSDGGTAVTDSAGYAYNVSVTLKTNTWTKTGYLFTKWNTASDGSGSVYLEGSSYTITSTPTFYATWVQASVITWNANNGTINGSSSINTTIAINTSTSGPGYTPTRSGYTFKGWSTSSAPGSSLITLPYLVSTTTITFYAQWQVSVPNVVGQTKTYAHSLLAAYGLQYSDNADLESGATYLNYGTVFYQSINSGTLVDEQTIVGLSSYTTFKTVPSYIGYTQSYAESALTTLGYQHTTIFTNVGATSSNNGTVQSQSASGTQTLNTSIQLTVYQYTPKGQIADSSSTTKQLTTRKRFDGSQWVDITIQKRYDGSAWVDISN